MCGGWNPHRAKERTAVSSTTVQNDASAGKMAQLVPMKSSVGDKASLWCMGPFSF